MGPRFIRVQCTENAVRPHTSDDSQTILGFWLFFALEAEVERVCVHAHGHTRKHALAS